MIYQTFKLNVQLSFMDIQPKFGFSVKIRFHFGYKIEILRDNGLQFGCSIQCNPKNDTMMTYKNIQNLLSF